MITKTITKEKKALPNQAFLKVKLYDHDVFMLPTKTKDSVVLTLLNEINNNNKDTTIPTYAAFEMLYSFSSIFNFPSEDHYVNDSCFSGWFLIATNDTMNKLCSLHNLKLNFDFYVVTAI